MENVDKIQSLLDIIDQETAMFSVLARKYEHPSYKELLAIGKPAIPFILNELKLRPGWWFHALQELSGENPAIEEITFDGAREKWLKWGEENNYI